MKVAAGLNFHHAKGACPMALYSRMPLAGVRVALPPYARTKQMGFQKRVSPQHWLTASRTDRTEGWQAR